MKEVEGATEEGNKKLADWEDGEPDIKLATIIIILYFLLSIPFGENL